MAEIVPRSLGRSAQKLDYRRYLEELKERIRRAQLQASTAANQELLLLYYSIGLDLHLRLREEAWGTRIIDRLSADLRRAFPGLDGFSPRNLRRMRAFYRAYPLGEASLQIWPPAVAKSRLMAKWPPAVARLPWAHNVILLEKVKESALRAWYAERALEHGWSRNILAMQIESHLHARQGKAVTNFTRTLPPPQSDLAEQVLKDPYVFDFLTLAAKAREHELEQGLIDHVQKFLLELGVGFAFIGRQVHLEVGTQNFFVDLLFYHVKLRCFVVIELKAVPFEPEFAGKMNFYLSAVDTQMRHPDDRPSIGLLLCKSKDRLVVEYALRDLQKPIGVAQWETRLVESLPEELRGSLPTVEELEAELAGKEGRDR